MVAMSSKMDKVIVAMSGGVDSSVAASLLIEAGYDVTGVFMCLGHAGADSEGSGGCCSPTDAADARRVAETLGIELFVLDCSDAFGPVIENFLDEYAHGRTPNPCVHCNRLIKFGRLMDRADSLGVRFIATGHHARVLPGPGGEPAIHRGRAWGKDQSYALFDIPRDKLGRIVLPIGEIDDKARVRERAMELGLNVHDKPDSQEVCFVPDDDYAELLRQRRPDALRPGEIVDADGNVLGTHDGYARYTIGQRRGLGIAAGVPMYVTAIDPATARDDRPARADDGRLALGRARELARGRGGRVRRDGADPLQPSRRAGAGEAHRPRQLHRNFRRAGPRDHARPGGGRIRQRQNARRRMDHRGLRARNCGLRIADFGLPR